ncbi:hypothetical protein [Actinoplanes solisilvae]|uniref:hypothetical protein n=1 Tax=Actinoplanes solisilvae TaxID=2486853 RepID=UPI000FD92686|nr:hypothetical protein [Actinoplanes solisilvae]
MKRDPAVAALGTLLDRSVARIGELTSDGRFFDRREVARIADIWDNNTMPFFAVLTSPERAREALDWMAAFSPERRAWMIQQVPDVAPLLSAAPPREQHYRDYRDAVRPGTMALTTALADTYDLASAEVSSFTVERTGSTLSADVELQPERAFPAPSGTRDVKLWLHFSDVRGARFDSDDAVGASMLAGGDVRLGGHGYVHAAEAEVWIDDDAWHLSPVGKAADAVTPPRQPRTEVTWPAVVGEAGTAAFALYERMLRIRMVRSPGMVGRVPLRTLSAALAKAGSQALDANGRFLRNRAFTRLAHRWNDIAAPPRPPAAAPGDHLTLAQLNAGHNTIINSAVRDDDGTWALRSASLPCPAGSAVRAEQGTITVEL